MTNIPKHHTKLKRKTDDSKIGWIYLFVVRNSISVCNDLKGSSERVKIEPSWRHYFTLSFPKLGNWDVCLIHESAVFFDLSKSGIRSPKQSSKYFICFLKFVEVWKDRLLSNHEPFTEFNCWDWDELKIIEGFIWSFNFLSGNSF